MNYILFNPKSKNGKAKEIIENIRNSYQSEYKAYNILEIDNYSELFKDITCDDEITIIGGDGTLNHFVNDIKGLEVPCKIYYHGAGTGNDFLKDIGHNSNDGKLDVTKYLSNLPTATINGNEYLFINGIGFGIDGYCCEEGDRLQAKSNKPVNYTSIAIKGLLFHYKAPNAKIIVDGVEKHYKKVWIAASMKGKYYGGGMMVAPDQDRLSKDNEVSLVVLHGSGKIKTLIVFPSIFKGKHVTHKEMVDVITGHHISVEFDRPTSLQVDGETILGVTKYEVHTN